MLLLFQTPKNQHVGLTARAQWRFSQKNTDWSVHYPWGLWDFQAIAVLTDRTRPIARVSSSVEFARGTLTRSAFTTLIRRHTSTVG